MTLVVCQCAGMIAGTIQSAVITPVDLLKIRMQMQTATQGTSGYVGSIQMLRRVLQTEGFFGELLFCEGLAAHRHVMSYGCICDELAHCCVVSLPVQPEPFAHAHTRLHVHASQDIQHDVLCSCLISSACSQHHVGTAIPYIL